MQFWTSIQNFWTQIYAKDIGFRSDAAISRPKRTIVTDSCARLLYESSSAQKHTNKPLTKILIILHSTAPSYKWWPALYTWCGFNLSYSTVGLRVDGLELPVIHTIHKSLIEDHSVRQLTDSETQSTIKTNITLIGVNTNSIYVYI